MDFSPHLSTSLVGILIGLFLVVSHLVALLAPDFFKKAAKDFPRSRATGTVLLSLTALWLVAITASGDLGEFSPLRNLILLGVIAFSFLLWKFVPDFLASRSLGFLLLLAAHPVLESTFLQKGVLHLALVLIAYAWATVGLFLVGMPYLHRDLIGWVIASKSRWNLGCWAGLFYGLLLLVEGARRSLF